jgi:hypothetical protein
MRIPKVILGFVLAVVLFSGLAFLAFTLFSSRYLRFMGKDKTYYSDVAHACDLILHQHPVRSNDTVTLYEHMTLPYTIKLSGCDTSLPKIIKALHPDSILVSTNRVFIDIPPERMGGFGVIWEQDETRSNYWTLKSNGDGLVKTVYEELKLTFN